MTNKKLMEMRKMEQKTEYKLRDMSWLKGLLNNLPLLKWVRKYSADGLMETNKMAEGFSIKVNEDSISVADDTFTKILTTNSRFAGKELARYNIKQIADTIKLLGDEGELLITESKHKEMVVQIGNTTILVCALPSADKRGD